ncbi:MAG: hypothetical protein U0R17_03385 [Acidimicrobiia bacterium]
MKKIAYIALVLVFILTITSCSKDSKDKPKDLRSIAEQRDAKGLNASARLLAEGIVKADGNQVFDQISTQCQFKLSKTSIVKQLRTVRAYLTTFLGASLDDFSIKSIETRNVKTGKTGQARYTILIEGKSRELVAKALGGTSTTASSSTSTTVPNQETTTTVSTFPFDKPTDWFEFVYEGSSWKLQSCDEFLKSSGLFSQQK